MSEKYRLINQIVDKYLGSVSSAREAYLNDAYYHAQIQLMGQLLEVFDLAMEQEGFSHNPRLKVLERVMMAAPDPAEAMKRMEMLKKMTLSPWKDEPD